MERPNAPKIRKEGSSTPPRPKTHSAGTSPMWRKRRHYLMFVAGAAVAAALLLGVGSGLGWFLPASTTTLTVSSAHWSLLQGVNPQGTGWFGPSSFNYTGGTTGFPLVVPAGTTFTVTLVLSSFSNSSHSIASVVASAPFAVVKISPGLPNVVAPHQDDAMFQVLIRAPAAAGVSPYVLYLTVTAESG